MTRWILPLAAALALTPSLAAQRTKSRLLHSFESPTEVKALARGAESAELDAVMDRGVTHGRNCLRWVAKRGSAYSVVKLPAADLPGGVRARRRELLVQVGRGS